MWKLGRPAESPVARVEIGLEAAQRRLDRLGRQLRVVRRLPGMHSLEGGEQGLVLLGDLAAVLAPDLRDALEHLGKTGKVVALLLGEIGAAEEGRALRSQEHGERPATRALREHLVRELVDLIEVGSLLA